MRITLSYLAPERVSGLGAAPHRSPSAARTGLPEVRGPAQQSLRALRVWLWVLCLLLSLPAPREALALRFVAMGDSRGSTLNAPINTVILGQVNQQIAALNPSPELLVFYGDMSVSGNTSRDSLNPAYTFNAWLDFMRLGATPLPASLALYLAIGNHELYDEAYYPNAGALLSLNCQQAYQNFIQNNISSTFMQNTTSLDDAAYKHLAYSFTADNGQTLFVVLDGFFVNTAPYIGNQRSGSLDETQLNYLQATLRASSAKTKFVFTHNPAFEPTSQAYHACWTPSMCQFWQIINDNNVTAVFNGHTHMYSRVMINAAFNGSNSGFNFTKSIPQIVAGTSGAPIYSVANEPPNWNIKRMYNYAVVDVDNSGPRGNVVVQAYCSDGTTPWALCDTYVNTPLSPAISALLLQQDANGQGQ